MMEEYLETNQNPDIRIQAKNPIVYNVYVWPYLY